MILWVKIFNVSIEPIGLFWDCCNFREFVKKWLYLSNSMTKIFFCNWLKIKFEPSLNRSRRDYLKIIKGHSPKGQQVRTILVSKYHFILYQSLRFIHSSGPSQGLKFRGKGGGHVIFSGNNVPPMVEIGLTDLKKVGGTCPSGPPACDRPSLWFMISIM